MFPQSCEICAAAGVSGPPQHCALLNRPPLPPLLVADIMFIIIICNLLPHEQHAMFTSTSSSSSRLDIYLEMVRELCEEEWTHSKLITHITKGQCNCTAISGTKSGLLEFCHLKDFPATFPSFYFCYHCS